MKGKAILRSLLLAYGVTGLFLLILAFLLFQFGFGGGTAAVGIIIIYVVSCLAGGFLAGKAARQRRFLWGLFTGILYFLILFFASFAVSRELGAGSRELLTVFLMCAGSGTIGGMVS